MRLAARQSWPVVWNLASMAAWAASSTSMSGKTMKGALPPSSIEHFFTVAAACCNNRRPTRVEPVKDNALTLSLAQSTWETISGSPVMTLNTPAGKPARSASSAKARAENGVSPAGLTSTVQPTASAAAALRVIIAQGKFHGVIKAATPIGSRTLPSWALRI